MKLSLPPAEYAAISAIRGLDADAHMMVMCATRSPDFGAELSGSEAAFEALYVDLCVEIDESLCRAAAVAPLRRAIGRIDALLGHDELLDA